MGEFYYYPSTIPDQREDYGELRYITYGMIDSRLHVLVWMPRGTDVCRVVSLRKANSRESKRYGKTKITIERNPDTQANKPLTDKEFTAAKRVDVNKILSKEPQQTLGAAALPV